VTVLIYTLLQVLVVVHWSAGATSGVQTVGKRGIWYDSPVAGGLAMKRFIKSTDRDQTTLFPASLEDYAGEDNPARIIACLCR